VPGGDDLGHGVEVAGADLVLVADGGVAVLGGGKLGLLQLAVGGHAAVAVLPGELVHAVVEGVEAGQGDELVLVAHGAELALEPGDGAGVELGGPVERRRAVVHQELAGELLVDGLGEQARLLEIGLARLAPDQVGVRGVGEAARDGGLEPVAHVEVALGGALAGGEGAVALVHVAGQQGGGVGVGAGDDEGGDAADVGGESGRDEGADEGLGRHEHLAAEVTALLLAGELILVVNARGAGLDHALHELVGVEGAAEAGLGVGHDGREPVGGLLAVDVVDLVGALQRLVDALDERRDAVGGVQALVGVDVAGEVGVGGGLPSADVDRLEAGADLLHGLVAGDGAERGHERLAAHQLPEALGAEARQRVFDLHRAAQADDVLGGVGASDTRPAGVLEPVVLQGLGVSHYRLSRCPDVPGRAEVFGAERPTAGGPASGGARELAAGGARGEVWVRRR